MTDLRSRLHDVVDGPVVPDAARPGDHGNGRGATALDDVLVSALTTRVRRRRAVRAGALGTVGALTVAALAVGGAAVADRIGPAPVPPATRGPAPDGVATPALDCGTRVTAESIRPVDGGMAFAALEIAVGDVPAGTPLDVTVRLENQGDPAAGWNVYDWDTRQDVELAAVRDGVVVATARPILVASGEYAPGSALTTSQPVTLTPCAGDTELAPGDYALVASAILANDDGSGLVMLSQGPVPFTVRAAPPEPAEPAEDEGAAEEAVRALITGADAGGDATDRAVGACGTRLEARSDPLLLLDLTLTGSTYRPGALIEGDAAITARDGLAVLANAPITAVHVVLVRDGVVVGRGEYDPEYVDLMTFTDERAYPLPAYGNAIVCALPGTDATGLALPSGTYQAFGLYEVTLKEVQRDATAEARSDSVTVVSEPVDVVIGTPEG